LRKTGQTSLGPQYAGSRISREEAIQEEEDDPFTRGYDELEEEEEGSEEAEDENESEDGEDLSEIDSNMEDEDDDDADEEDEDDESGDSDAEAADNHARGSTDAEVAKIKQILAREQKTAASTLLQAAQQDIAKGVAIKKQRSTFDNLLNMRIKLQKSIIGSNTLAGLARDSKLGDVNFEEASKVIKNAEEAAFNLWTSLTSLRDTLQSSNNDNNYSHKKRNYDEFTTETPINDLWTFTQSQTSSAQSNWDNTLDKWYNKTHVTEITAQQSRNRLNVKKPNGTASVNNIRDILNNTLNDSNRLLRRAQTPRSCAPYQLSHSLSKKPTPSSSQTDVDVDTLQINTGDPTVYDDADFYSLLLTTLLDQRSSLSSQPVSKTSDGLKADPASLLTSGYQLRREAKTRKQVDTKASKGRKMRYTVHEKIMNYCAQEDRGTWGDRQVDELFAGLLGRQGDVGLDEDETKSLNDGHEERSGEEGDLQGDEARLLFG